MTTGPEHYRKAERLLDLADDSVSAAAHAWMMSEAQVHATLALAAATVYGGHGLYDPTWADATDTR